MRVGHDLLEAIAEFSANDYRRLCNNFCRGVLTHEFSEISAKRLLRNISTRK
jgi:hypothetical protein